MAELTFADPQSTVIVAALIFRALAAVRVTPLGAISSELPPLSSTRTELARSVCDQGVRQMR